MATKKEYPLKLTLITQKYGKRSLKYVNARETSSFYFVDEGHCESKYKKLDQPHSDGCLTDAYWGSAGGYRSSTECLYPLVAKGVDDVTDELMLENIKSTVDKKVRLLIQKGTFEQLEQVEKLVDSFGIEPK